MDRTQKIGNGLVICAWNVEIYFHLEKYYTQLVPKLFKTLSSMDIEGKEPTTIFSKLWQRLTEPSETLLGGDRRRQSRIHRATVIAVDDPLVRGDHVRFQAQPLRPWRHHPTRLPVLAVEMEDRQLQQRSQS